MMVDCDLVCVIFTIQDISLTIWKVREVMAIVYFMKDAVVNHMVEGDF